MYGSYPLTLGICLGVSAYAVWNRLDYRAVHGALMMGVLLSHVALELLLPLDRRWGMSLRSFFGRDLKYLALNGVVESLGRIGVGTLAIQLSLGSHGPLRTMPVALSLPVMLLTFEFLQYWYHRWSHELGGKAGRFLWRVHAAHHLPEQVYVLMHVVGHPLNLLATNIVLMALLPYLLGCSPEVVFLFSVISNLQGIVSHLNLDIRVGPLNYLLAGTEVHRWHHSTRIEEAKNYGAVLMIFDLLFGTFVYRKGENPRELGVAEPARYPRSGQILRVLALPFVRDRLETDLQPLLSCHASTQDSQR